MTFWLPLVLVTLGSALHALWNVLAKRHGTSDPTFVWVYSALALPGAGALLLWAAASPGSPRTDWWATTWTSLVSTLLHTGYAVVLQRSYARADMTAVYPVARGMAPVIVTGVAITWSGAPTAPQTAGLALVLAGTALTGGWRSGSGAAQGMLVATCVAGYTLWDAWAVGVLEVDLLGYVAMAGMAQLGVLTIALWPRRRQLPGALAATWRPALPVAVLAPASYGLVLLALRLGPPGMVASARTLTIVFGVVLGVWLLREQPTSRAWAGIALICLGRPQLGRLTAPTVTAPT